MTKEDRYYSAMDACERAHRAVANASKEWRKVIELYEATLSTWNYCQTHGTDINMTNIMQMLIGPLQGYLEQRMAAPGVRRDVETWKRRITIDVARREMVQKIIELGVDSSEEAAGIAAQVLADSGHPAGMTERGEYADASTIRKSAKRADKAMIPAATWQLPGETNELELPDPRPYIKP